MGSGNGSISFHSQLGPNKTANYYCWNWGHSTRPDEFQFTYFFSIAHSARSAFPCIRWWSPCHCQHCRLTTKTWRPLVIFQWRLRRVWEENGRGSRRKGKNTFLENLLQMQLMDYTLLFLNCWRTRCKQSCYGKAEFVYINYHLIVI